MGWTRYEQLARHIDVNCTGKTEDPWELPLRTTPTTKLYKISTNAACNKNRYTVVATVKKSPDRGKNIIAQVGPLRYAHANATNTMQLSLDSNENTNTQVTSYPVRIKSNKRLALKPIKQPKLRKIDSLEFSSSSQCRHKINNKYKNLAKLSVSQSQRLSYCPASDRLGQSWNCNLLTGAGSNP